MPTNILTVIVVWILSIMAIKHIAYILIYGSIFGPLRSALREQAGAGIRGWVFRKINGMFTCNLCMVTQLTFWIFILPLFIFVHYPFEAVDAFFGVTRGGAPSGTGSSILAGISFIVVWMSTASLSIWYWNLSEFRIERFEKLRAYYEQLLSQTAAGGGKPIVLNHDTAKALLRFIDDNCHYIDCSFSRRNCSYHRMREWADEIRKEQGISTAVYLPSEVMDIIAKMYFHSNSNEKGAAKLLKKIF